MKQFAKKTFDKMPWMVRRIAYFSKQTYTSRRPPFEGVFKSFQDIPVNQNTRKNWSDVDDWGDKARIAALRSRNEIGKIIPESSAISKSLLPVIVSTMMLRKKKIKILDFGGAAGLDFANLLAQTGNIPDIEYKVVDIASACNAGRKAWADDTRISFSTDLPDSSEKFDIVYSYSAVHCVENYKDLLEKFASYNPDIMLFCKHSICDNPTFARRQTNVGTGFFVPLWALNIREVADILEKKHYQLIFRGFGEDVYNVDNYKGEYKVGRMTNLVFVRSNND